MREFLNVLRIEITGFPKVEAAYWIFKYLQFRLRILLETYIGEGNINDWEMRVYSQNGEDGIIQYIFRKIGETNKYFVEFGAEDGRECNTRYLREKGWDGLWMDGNFKNTLVKKEIVTPENVEQLFNKYKVPKEFDLLSIDIDSYDYWVWKAITHYNPRVVVIEFNSTIPINKSLTVPYDPKFHWDSTNYFGASLKAMVKLSKIKHYQLVGCDSKGINAFFVREDVAAGKFTLLSHKEIYRPPKFGIKKNGKWTGYPKSPKKMVVV